MGHDAADRGLVTPFQKRIVIDGRTPDEVFGFISDPNNDPVWRDSTVSFEWLTEEREGVGSRFRATDRLLGLNISYEVEIIRWEPPHIYGARAGGMAAVDFIATLTSEGDSSTAVELNGHVEFNGILRLFGPLFGAQFTKQFGLEWDNLKQVLESPDAPPTDAD